MLMAACVAAYALSPIDLIPDFVPVLGYLDDVIILPFGIMLAVWMIPRAVMAEHRATVSRLSNRPISKAAGAAIVAIWIAALGLTLWLAGDIFQRNASPALQQAYKASLKLQQAVHLSCL
jgi:Protein of unknown function (DUF1232)